MGQLTQPYLPATPAGCPKLTRQAPIRWPGKAEKGPKAPDFSYEMGLTHRLTGQGKN